MILDPKTYADKLRGCILGKNIGGTLGGPLECKQSVLDVDFYVHDITKGVLPNDDLDLQIAFLCAAEKYGVGVNSRILGGYWNTYIVPDWAEYGFGKRNLRAGLVPPLSGYYQNIYGESNGAWIRSELWACLAPGRPDIAVRYAYEDASVDHFGCGVYAEMFTAALESAAFATSDPEKAIDVALSYIPPDCDIAKVVAFVRACKDDPTIDWKAARKKVLIAFPSSFGRDTLPGQSFDPDIPLPDHRKDSPAGIGITLIGHYYGGGDFSRALCIAAGCCDDSDCTAGTLGAFYGILYGTAGIPEKWIAPIGDEIKTCSLDTTKPGIPTTVTEMCERIARLMPVFMENYLHRDEEGRFSVEMRDENDLRAPKVAAYYWGVEEKKAPLYTLYPADGLTMRQDSGGAMAFVRLSSLNIHEGEPWDCTAWITYYGCSAFGSGHTNRYTVTVHVPAEWEAPNGRTFIIDQPADTVQMETETYTFIPRDLRSPTTPVLVEFREIGGPDCLCFPVVLFHR